MHRLSRDGWTIAARELIPDGGDSLPVLVYLQGGPGMAAPRPLRIEGWIGAALEHYRVVLLDQRGTGHSSPLDTTNVAEPEVYTSLRAPDIVADCEALRDEMGVTSWNLLGQSFGGFIATCYMGLHPQRIDRAYITGGLPALSVGADDIYRATYAALARRHAQFTATVPFADSRIREIAHHLATTEEYLPTGEQLTARRFRTIGIELGRAIGLKSLGYLLEEPFHTVRGEKRLTGAFLAEVGQLVSFAAHPLYAVVHESIYAGLPAGVPTTAATNWSAHRMRAEVAGFAEDADPTSLADPFYLTGEHIYPWLFTEDPALVPFTTAAQHLAAKEDWKPLYNLDGLAHAETRVAAAIYTDDIYVPRQFSEETATYFRHCRTWVTGDYQHSGLRDDGATIFNRLHALLTED